LYQGESLDSLSPRPGRNPILKGRDFEEFSGIGVADPFAIKRNNDWYLFFELFLKDKPNAVIASAKSSNLDDWTPLGIVLEQPHHLSYPFVFEHDGQIYMMPESKSVRRLDLYRAVEFPFRWMFEKTILRGRLMDCSMVQHNGLYWIFAGWRSYWLRIFYASNPLGPWKSHLLPVVRNYSKSFTRPGGRPVVWNDQMIRFSQDNLLYYGQQLRAMHVTTLNRLWFSERPLFRHPILKGSGAGWNASCMHHIDAYRIDNPTGNSQGLLAFVDGCECFC
jgi:hypothetical protein